MTKQLDMWGLPLACVEPSNQTDLEHYLEGLEEVEEVVVDPLHLVIVGCVKTKQDTAAAARDLYTSDLFNKRRAYAENTGRPWYIMSALHGLVHPDEEIEPYDHTITDAKRRFKDRKGGAADFFAGTVWSALALELQAAEPGAKIRSLNTSRITLEVYAGAPYVKMLRDAFANNDNVTVTAPLQGLQLGERKRWYNQQGKEVEA